MNDFIVLTEHQFVTEMLHEIQRLKNITFKSLQEQHKIELLQTLIEMYHKEPVIKPVFKVVIDQEDIPPVVKIKRPFKSYDVRNDDEKLIQYRQQIKGCLTRDFCEGKSTGRYSTYVWSWAEMVYWIMNKLQRATSAEVMLWLKDNYPDIVANVEPENRFRIISYIGANMGLLYSRGLLLQESNEYKKIVYLFKS